MLLVLKLGRLMQIGRIIPIAASTGGMKAGERQNKRSMQLS
jgi:hypothetical protein